MEKQPNILFIVVDTLRDRNLGCYGYTKPTSPNIDKLEKEGVLFEKAYSCSPCSFPSLTSIFSSEYPLSHGVVERGPTVLPHRKVERIAPRTVFLPEVLKSRGYTTIGVDWVGGWLRRGYDYYTGLRGLTPRICKVYGQIWKLAKPINNRIVLRLAKFVYQQKIHARIMSETAGDLLRRVRDRRFFLLVHFCDMHVPMHA